MTEKQHASIADLTEKEIQEIAIHALTMEGSCVDESESGGELGEERKTRYTILTWSRSTWSPLVFTDGRLKVWENGDWEYHCIIDNDSQHSDWWVEVDIRIKSSFNGSIVRTLATDVARTRIKHHDDPKMMRATGNDIWLHWNFDRIRNGDYIGSRNHTRWRAN